MDVNERIKYLAEKSNNKKIDSVVKEINADLFDSKGAELRREEIKKGNIEKLRKDVYIRRFIEILLNESKVDLRGKADEPVTTDIKRLIRVCNSIHGKTGFKSVPVGLDEIKEFEPLNDALYFSSSPVKIKINQPVKIRLKNEQFNLDVGENELPEYAAIFILCRGFGEL